MTHSQALSPSTLLQSVPVVEWAAASAPELVQVAVAFTGRLLADLGATVVRVEPAKDALSSLRSAPLEDLSAGSVLATFLHRGKTGIDEAAADDALRRSQLAVLSTAGMAEEHPKIESALSTVRVSCGRPGAGLDEAPTSDLGIQGLVGLTDLFGEPDGQPLAMGGHQVAYSTGYAAFCAAMALLAKRRLGGQADCAEVNALDALAWVNWKGIAAGTLGFPIRREGYAAQAPVLRCADGYFAFLHLPPNWDEIRAAVNDPRLEDDRFKSPGRRAKNAAALNKILADWARPQTREALYAFCQRCAIPGGPVLYGADLLKDAGYRYRHYFASVQHGLDRVIELPGLPITVEGTAMPTEPAANDGTDSCTGFASGDASTAEGTAPNHPAASRGPAQPATSAIGDLSIGATHVPRSDDEPSSEALPLAGMTVLDLGIFTAGSVTSTLLADLGARVIKVESETYSDPFRVWPGIKGDSPLFTFNNRNKLGVNIDLKTEAGREIFLKLAAKADIVVENFRRGVMERLGIGYAVLKAANPRIVLASISGQGASGPGSAHVSFGSTLEAIGGVASLTGYAQGPCYISGRNLNYPDQIVCLYGAGAALAALLKARELGTGMHIDVSQREVTSLAVGERIGAASLESEIESERTFPGNSSLNATLQDIFKVEDGWLCVTVPNTGANLRLAQQLGCADEQVAGELAAWLANRPAEVACRTLRPLGIAAHKANTGAEAALEPAIREGWAFARTPADKMVKGFPFQFLKTPLKIYGESPKMGEHTQSVLGDL